MNEKKFGLPGFVKAAAGVVGAGLLSIGSVAYQIAQDRDGRRQDECERVVQSREDGRAVWLYLVGRDPERRDDPDVVEFVEFLNDRLPPLECDGGYPVVKESDG